MPNIDYIKTTLNISENDIKDFDSIIKDDTVHIYLTLTRKKMECIYCGGPTNSNGHVKRNINMAPTANMKTILHWKSNRYICLHCHRTFSEPNPFGPANLNQSYDVLLQVSKDLANPSLSYKSISQKNHISETRVAIYADSFLAVPKLSLPENIGIDELHSDMARYGSSYLCVLVDNEERTLFELLNSRSKYTLTRYFDSFTREERLKVKYVTIDMWQPYKDAVSAYLPNAKIAVDSFHVIENLNTAFTHLRVEVMNQQPDGSAGYYLLKHWNRLLMGDFNLDGPRKYNHFFGCMLNYRDILDLLLNIDQRLKVAYELKEEYRKFNKEATKNDCAERFKTVHDHFVSANISVYAPFISLLDNWKNEIINSFDRPYENRRQSNALAENINGRLRTMINVSNGLSNFSRFRSRAIYCFNHKVSYSITNQLFSNKRPGKKRGKYNKSL